jgi:hypothetical protein
MQRLYRLYLIYLSISKKIEAVETAITFLQISLTPGFKPGVNGMLGENITVSTVSKQFI